MTASPEIVHVSPPTGPAATERASAGLSGDARTLALEAWRGDPESIFASDLLDLLTPPVWHADALCKEYPGVDFLPTAKAGEAAAKAVCARCLVRAECEAAARDDDEGIWGGRNKAERRQRRFSVSSRRSA